MRARPDGHDEGTAVSAPKDCHALSERPYAFTQEPFVSAEEAARFLGVKRRFLLDLARDGIAGAYPIGTGSFRKTWIFRLSELGVAIDHRHPRPFPPPQDKRRYDPDGSSR
jgi:hypothetical protein